MFRQYLVDEYRVNIRGELKFLLKDTHIREGKGDEYTLLAKRNDEAYTLAFRCPEDSGCRCQKDKSKNKIIWLLCYPKSVVYVKYGLEKEDADLQPRVWATGKDSGWMVIVGAFLVKGGY